MVNNFFEKTVERSEINGTEYEIRRRSGAAVKASAAPYTLWIAGEFFCTCDTFAEAREEAREELDRKQCDMDEGGFKK